MKADALMRFLLSGNRSLEEFVVLLARISLGVFFAISGGNKLFVASQYNLMYETIVGAGIPFPHVMTYFVSSVEFICGCLLIIGLLSTLCCAAFIIDMIVAITTVQLATITKALSFIDWLDDFLYLPEVMYIIIFLWLISSGPGRLSVDHWIAVRSGDCLMAFPPINVTHFASWPSPGPTPASALGAMLTSTRSALSIAPARQRPS